jgi:hypothetical protein
MPGACSVVSGGPVANWEASSRLVSAGTGVAVMGADARGLMPGACGIVPVWAVDTGIVSSRFVSAGTGVAVIGAGAETDLAAIDFAFGTAGSARSIDEAAGVSAPSGSWPVEAIKFEEGLELDEGPKPEAVFKEDGAPEG